MEPYEPEIMGAGIFDSARSFPGTAKTPVRAVRQYEVELFLASGGVSYIGAEAFPVRRGAVLLARPGDRRHSLLPVSARFLRFAPHHPAMEKMLSNLPRHFSGDFTDLLLPFFIAAEEASASADASAGVRRIRAICDLICTLDELAHSIENAPAVTAPAVRYMEEHYGEALNTGILASCCHLSETHFHRLFLKERHRTPGRYLSEVRLLAAKRLLAENVKPLSEVALLCGFSSQAYFTYCFRRQYGTTPAHYREEAAYRP